jgi:hypothetical protein
MVDHDDSWDEMPGRDAVSSLCSVAAYPLSDEALIALSQILGQYSLNYGNSQRDIWGPDKIFLNPVPLLVRLLSATCTGVRLAAADALKHTVCYLFCAQPVHLFRSMRLLCSDCRSLAELEPVLSVICAFFHLADVSWAEINFVQPFLTCLYNESPEVQMGALIALRSLAASRDLKNHFRATIMRHLIPHLSTDDDVDYVVFARTAMHWIDFDHDVDSQNIIRRLLRLLSYHQDFVVTNAALGFRCMRGDLTSYVFQVGVLNGASPLVRILSSSNSIVVGEALDAIHSFLADHKYASFFIAQGVIPAVAPYLSTDLLLPALRVIYSLLPEDLEKITGSLSAVAMIEANIIQHLVRLIPTCPRRKEFGILVDIIVLLSFEPHALDELERAGFAPLLIPRMCCIGEEAFEALLYASAEVRKEFERALLANTLSIPVWLKSYTKVQALPGDRLDDVVDNVIGVPHFGFQL